MLRPIVSSASWTPIARAQTQQPAATPEQPDIQDQVQVSQMAANPSFGDVALSSALTALNLAGQTHLHAAIAVSQFLSRERPTQNPAILSMQPRLPPPAPIGERSALRDSPAVQLERPMVIVPGYHTRVDQLEPLVEKLTEGGQNGQACYFYNGSFYADRGCSEVIEQPPADTRLFISLPYSGRDNPDLVADQLTDCLARIRSATGTDKVDALAYSMGGLSCQRYLDRGGESLGKLLMVGTPNGGSGLAHLSLKALDAQSRGNDLKWLMARSDVIEEDRQALEWLAPKSAIREDMQSRWPQQRGLLEAAFIVGGASLPTFYWGAMPMTRGDGVVDASSLALGDTEVKLVSGHSRHGALLYHPEVYSTMIDFFDWSRS